ncbi:glycosyltransferase involved in cell wall biosynthesis [Lacibacter cauensis]|uniref:Glycosyltransferase involved in cell wall biosynthesis n=1 Tax=Lacibacter cauensis TaxID=510947 RepID=A0A562SK61_9BACT|nr:glycosyltransferase [Lacibacter cauensis]TWI81384.1 glycosyltransferase involved in cell wall biosynthesis [Lacibacter cauensis]
MSKPRLLIILNRLATGGPALNTLCMAEGLSNVFDVLVVAGEPNADEQAADYLLDQYKGFRFQKLTALRRSVLPAVDWRAYHQLKKIIKEFKPAIVHTHGTKPGVLGRLAAHRCKVPVVVHTFHGHVFHSYFPPFVSRCIVQIERWLAGYSTAIIAISDILQHELTTTYRIARAEKIKLVRLGIATASFADETGEKRLQFRKQFQLDDATKAIGIVGRLVPIKQHRLFIDTAIRLLQTRTALPAFRFFIVGDGAEKQALQQYIVQRGFGFTNAAAEASAEKPFVFTSWRTDMDVVFAGLDLVLLTSLNEGTPVSVMEAMAAGKPVVATNVGGVAELVQHGQTGFLAASANELCARVAQLLEQPSLAAEMGVTARQIAKERFSETSELASLTAFYDELLALKSQ